MAKLISAALIVTAAFLALVVPFYLAPWGFYNGFPILTGLLPLMFLLAAVFAGAGTLYYVFEKREK